MIRLKKITFYDHKIFGNKSFDFTKNGNAVNNIIFAGENGSGKTKLLEELYNIGSMGFYPNHGSYTIKTHEILIDISDENYVSFEDENIKMDEALLLITYREDRITGSNKIIFKSNNSDFLNVKKLGSIEKVQMFKMNSLFSTVDINYKPINTIQGITSKTLDVENNTIPTDMASEIIQLLVDISIQDSCDLDSWVSQHRNIIPPEEIFHKRLKRFTNAFKIVFNDNIKFKEIKNNIIPIFIKNNNEIEITSLSSGEKQIIFRGVYLLRNKNSLKGVPILIDEPEISMHPKWEEKIFNYYQTLSSDNDIQTSQIFVATHSEHVLAEALKRDDTVIIKFTNNEHQTFYKGCSGIILPTITLAEIKYSIFDLYTTDYHALLYGYIQQNLICDDNGQLIVDPSVNKTDKWLKDKGMIPKHYTKTYSNGDTYNYKTLSTYIRNCIDHPDDEHSFTTDELMESTNKMIDIINNH